MKILIIFGTRPEYIKLLPIVNELKKQNLQFDTCFTGQHKYQIGKLFTDDKFTPTYNFGLNFINDVELNLKNTINAIVSNVSNDQYSAVVVQGDTTSALAGAKAAKVLGIPVIHIEAGLRTHDFLSPFPEEYNRVEIAKIANMHFAVSELGKKNLLDEGICKDDIYVVGNTIVDYIVANIQEPRNPIQDKILITMHRRENDIKYILENIYEVVKEFPETEFVIIKNNMPSLATMYLGMQSNNLKIIDALNSRDFYKQLQSSKLVITDSGGLQEECVTLNIPIAVLRKETERVEALKSENFNMIDPRAKDLKQQIIKVIKNIKQSCLKKDFNHTFGNGDSAIKIIETLKGRKIW